MWYERNWLVILLLILFFPLGFYGLWLSRNFSRSVKNCITGLAALAAISWYAHFEKMPEAKRSPHISDKEMVFRQLKK